MFDHADGSLDAHGFEAPLPQPSRVAAVIAIELLIFLPPSETGILSVDDDDVVANIKEGCVDRLVLPLKQLCGDGGDPAKDLRLCVDDVPATVYVLR